MTRRPTPGSISHVEVNVADLERAVRSWGSLLEHLGYVPFQDWRDGRSWRLGEAYVVLVRVPEAHRGRAFDRRGPGLNHVAFHAASREEVDDIVAAARSWGWTLLYPERHPFAGGPETYAAFLEDGERMKVELAAPEGDAPSAADLLAAYAEAHEEGLRTGRYDRLASLFRRDGTLRFEGLPLGPFVGRDAIRKAFETRSPDDRLLVHEARPDGDGATAGYSWARTPVQCSGTLRVTARAGRLATVDVLATRP